MSLLLPLLTTPVPAALAGELPSGFVRLSDVDPTIEIHMRYATKYNFTGAVVPGYKANVCILAKPVAQALARVQKNVSAKGYSLKVYDCYRPTRAVAAFMRWGASPGSTPQTKIYFPAIAKKNVIPLGYIAERSSHSLGTAIDLTLVSQSKTTPYQTIARNAAGPCTGPMLTRFPDNSIDMGTSWDCFDVASHTRHPGISAQAKKNREILLKAMDRQGFKNYDQEWWHYSMDLRAYRKARNFDVE